MSLVEFRCPIGAEPLLFEELSVDLISKGNKRVLSRLNETFQVGAGSVTASCDPTRMIEYMYSSAIAESSWLQFHSRENTLDSAREMVSSVPWSSVLPANSTVRCSLSPKTDSTIIEILAEAIRSQVEGISLDNGPHQGQHEVNTAAVEISLHQNAWRASVAASSALRSRADSVLGALIKAIVADFEASAGDAIPVGKVRRKINQELEYLIWDPFCSDLSLLIESIKSQVLTGIPKFYLTANMPSNGHTWQCLRWPLFTDEDATVSIPQLNESMQAAQQNLFQIGGLEQVAFAACAPDGKSLSRLHRQFNEWSRSPSARTLGQFTSFHSRIGDFASSSTNWAPVIAQDGRHTLVVTNGPDPQLPQFSETMSRFAAEIRRRNDIRHVYMVTPAPQRVQAASRLNWKPVLRIPKQIGIPQVLSLIKLVR